MSAVRERVRVDRQTALEPLIQLGAALDRAAVVRDIVGHPD